MIKMNCPHCGHQLRIRSKFAGKQGQCKHCQGLVDVPNTYAEASSPPDLEQAGDVGTLSTESEKAKAALAESTALADLMNDDLPSPVAPTLPMAPDAMNPAAEKPTEILYKPLGCLYWALAIFLTPAALIMGIMLPSGHPQKKLAITVPIVFFVVSLAALILVVVVLPLLLLSTFDENPATANAGGFAITPSVVDMEVSPHSFVTLSTNNVGGMENDLTWQSSDASIAKVVSSPRSAMVYGMAPGTATVTAENIMTGEQAVATVNVTRPSARLPGDAPTAVVSELTYAQTRLPTFPTLTFNTTEHSDNELTGPLAEVDAATLTTFKGYVTIGYEEITAHFYEELRNRGWIIEDYGYGDEANSETYIIGAKDGNGIVYRTSKAASRTRVVITYGPLN